MMRTVNRKWGEATARAACCNNNNEIQHTHPSKKIEILTTNIVVQ